MLAWAGVLGAPGWEYEAQWILVLRCVIFCKSPNPLWASLSLIHKVKVGLVILFLFTTLLESMF